MSGIKPLTDRQQKLCEDNIPLAINIASKFIKEKGLPNKILPDYIFSGAYFGLVNAARLFKPAKHFKFSTYAVPAIYTGIFTELNQSDMLKPCQRKDVKNGKMEDIFLASIYGDIPEKNLAVGPDENFITKKYIEFLSSEFTDLEREIIDLRYNQGLSPIEIKRIKRSTRGKINWILRGAKDKMLKKVNEEN